jgi:hypothetical protein
VSAPAEPLRLLDWKRHVFSLYAGVRASDDPAAAWRLWRARRDELFSGHPESPLPKADREGFQGLPYFDYDAGARVLADIGRTEPRRYEIGTSGDGAYAFERFALAKFDLAGEPLELELYWLEGYGQGSRPGNGGRPNGPRLQLRVQPVLLL